MNLSTNPLFTYGIDNLCTICHLILKDTDNSHSIFSTLEGLETPGPVNVLQVLQSFSNYTFYNGPQMVCTTCYGKTIDVYKFIQMCNKAHENMQHYLKNVEGITTIKDETEVDVKIEEISIAPTRIIIDGRAFVLEMENEEISKFVDLEMVISGTEIKIEEGILQERMEKEEMSNYEESFISTIEIVTEEKTDSSDLDNLRVEKIDAQIHDERMGLIKCKDCHSVFSDKKELRDHRKEAKHTKEKLFLSELCKASFGTKSRLNTHIRVHSGDSHSKVKAHKCEQCNQQFTHAANLLSHMSIHNGIKVHKCEQCDRKFTRAAHLHSHMSIHNGVKVHKCEQCDRRFTLAANLSNHMDMHNGVKAHKCAQCDRQFAQASDLRSHMEIHNGIKAHKCEQCHRRFILAANLRKHMESHNGVNAHKCELCNRRFAQAANLRRHMDIHNGVKTHKCERCNRRFSQASDLRRHMDIHNGVKAHKCEQCNRHFSHTGNLRRHMDIHNGVKAQKCE